MPDSRVVRGTTYRAGAGILVGLWLMATGLFVAFQTMVDVSADPRAAVEAMVQGTAHKPFVYRALLPFVIRVLAAIFPLAYDTWAIILMYLSLLGFVMAFRYFWGALYRPSRLIDLASFCALVGLPLFFLQGKVYDFAVLFLFALGLALLARARWDAYLVVFLLATLNKETAVLLTLVFACHFYKKLPRRVFIQLLMAQFVGYGVIRLFLFWCFRDNPGGAAKFRLLTHWMALMQYPVLTGSTIVAAVLLIASGLYQWHKKPLFLRQAAWTIVPLLWITYLVFGYPFEIRVFYEAYAVLITMIVDSIARILRMDVTPAAEAYS